MNTLQVLADPIQSAISTNQKYYAIAKQCMVEAGHKGQLKGEVKAVRVLCSRNGKIPQAFSFCTEIRHVLVENGVKIVGEAAWRCCRQLQIVHLPDTAVGLLHGAFSKCQVLRAVVAPSCKYFGTKVFEECCSLTQVGAAHCPGNKLAPQAQLRPRAFKHARRCATSTWACQSLLQRTQTDVCRTAVFKSRALLSWRYLRVSTGWALLPV